jgi:hypothetical protein
VKFRSITLVFIILFSLGGLAACGDSPAAVLTLNTQPPRQAELRAGQTEPTATPAPTANEDTQGLTPTPTPNAAYTAIAIQKEKFATQSASHITMGALSYMATMTAAPTPPTGAAKPFVAINVNGSRYQDTIGSYAAKSGNTFYVIDLTVTNTSAKIVDLRQSFFRVLAGQTSTYPFSDKSYGLDKEIKNTILGPGEFARGELGFEVPRDQTITSIEFTDTSNKVAVIIK